MCRVFTSPTGLFQNRRRGARIALKPRMIIVGTDFSGDSLVALRTAERLSDAMRLPVRILHVKPHADSRLPLAMDEWLKRARLGHDDVIVKNGTPWLELLRYAEENDASLICIGAHGTSGYQALTAGSNARRLVLRSSVPVVVAPAVAKNISPKELAL